MRRRVYGWWMLGVSVWAIGGATGCVGTAIKTGINVVRGVQAKGWVLDTPSVEELAPFGTLEIRSISTDVPGIVSPKLLAELRLAVATGQPQGLREAFPGDGRVLSLDLIARFYKSKKLLGREGRLDLMVHLHDAETDQRIGRFYVEAITLSPVHTGEDDMAAGVVKEMADFLVKMKKGTLGQDDLFE